MMRLSRTQLLSGAAAVPLLVGLAVGGAGLSLLAGMSGPAIAQCNPRAIPNSRKACNPCAVKKAACNPCNPCAAKKAACNPCAAKSACSAANPCNPCAAKNPCAAAANPCNPCNPCSPCAAQATGFSCKCFVPRLQQAAHNNPCAAKKPACNPCAAKSACAAANPCNPCAAKKAACNPCAAKSACSAASPCNPCAAKKVACNPCAAKNPCAAANPCNPCAAKTAAANPCNPCAAKNPCAAANPCAANPCAAAAADVELTTAEAQAAYDCLYDEIRQAYAKTGVPATRNWQSWAAKYNTQPYVSATHGGRMVNNYSNTAAKKEYSRFDEAKAMPAGSVLIKDSFHVDASGRLAVGPLFLMEKMKKGFNPATGDWRYYMFTPQDGLFGLTKGKNSAGVQFCHDCHSAAEDNDFLFFLPEDVRVSAKDG